MQLDIDAAKVQASGSVRVEGPLLAFLQEAWEGGANPSFKLEAARLRVEKEHTDLAVETELVAWSHFPSSATPAFYEEARVEGTENREGYRWNLFATNPGHPPRLGISAGCASAHPSDEETLKRASRVGAHPLTEIYVGNALKWDCLTGATLTVTGDFKLSLWAWNATLTAPGVQEELWSGRNPSDQVPPGAPDLSSSVSQNQEIYLFAKNATMVVPVLSGARYTVLTGAQTTLTTTEVSVQGAAGNLALEGTRTTLEGSSLDFRGQSEGILSGVGKSQPFSLLLAATLLDKMTIDGQSVAIAPGQPAGMKWLGEMGALEPWVWGGGLLLLPFAVGHATALIMYQVHASLAGPARGVRHRIALGYSLLSTFQIDVGNVRFARFLAWRAIRVLPASAEGYLAHAETARRLNLYRAALRDHEALDDLLADGRQRAMNACNAALTMCRMGRLEEAVGWLQTAESQDPALAAQQAQRPDFDPVGDYPVVRALRLRGRGDSYYFQ